ncbi:hypothetical protein [Halorarum halobium]|uniref:hypothetical protein n=1 Tax=Halorarum halobium TaxID=3075121 RepID=UPI0028A83AD7|nr:hypothetical protein [Halobaculum sp. XH14]
MSLHPLVVAPPVVLLAMGVTYADGTRRSLTVPARLRWTLGIGCVSIGGFLAAFAFDGVVFRLYSVAVGRQFIVQSPRELLTILFSIGLVISTVAVLLYGVASRFGPLESEPPS